MVVVVLAVQVVDVGGADERPAELAGERARSPRSPCPARRSRCPGSRSRRSRRRRSARRSSRWRAGLVGPVLDDPAAEARLQAARQRDHALRVALEQLQVDVRLAAGEPLEEAGRGQLDEVAEAGVVRGQQRQVVALDLRPRSLAVVDEVGLEPEDRLDPVLVARLVVLDRAVHDAVVGEPERRHAELRGPRGEPASTLSAPFLTILHAPSSSEYSLWTCRWTTLPLTGPSWQAGQMPTLRESATSDLSADPAIPGGEAEEIGRNVGYSPARGEDARRGQGLVVAFAILGLTVSRSRLGVGSRPDRGRRRQRRRRLCGLRGRRPDQALPGERRDAAVELGHAGVEPRPARRGRRDRRRPGRGLERLGPRHQPSRPGVHPRGRVSSAGRRSPAARAARSTRATAAASTSRTTPSTSPTRAPTR